MYSLYATIVPVAETAWSVTQPGRTAHEARALGTMESKSGSATAGFSTSVRSVHASGSGSSSYSSSFTNTESSRLVELTSVTTATLTASTSGSSSSLGWTRQVWGTDRDTGWSYDPDLDESVTYSHYGETSSSSSSSSSLSNAPNASFLATATVSTVTTTNVYTRTIDTRTSGVSVTVGTTIGGSPATSRIISTITRSLWSTGGTFSAVTRSTTVGSWIRWDEWHSRVHTVYAQASEWMWSVASVLPTVSGLYPFSDVLESTTAGGGSTRYIETYSTTLSPAATETVTVDDTVAAGTFSGHSTGASLITRTISTVNETTNGTTTFRVQLQTTYTQTALLMATSTSTATASRGNGWASSSISLASVHSTEAHVALIHDSTDGFKVVASTIGKRGEVQSTFTRPAFGEVSDAGFNTDGGGSVTWTRARVPIVRILAEPGGTGSMSLYQPAHVAAGLFRASTAAHATDARFTAFALSTLSGGSTVSTAGAPAFLVGSHPVSFLQTVPSERVISGGTVALAGEESWMGIRTVVRNAVASPTAYSVPLLFGGRSQQPGGRVLDHGPAIGFWRLTLRGADQSTWTTSFAAIPDWGNLAVSRQISWTDAGARVDWEAGALWAGFSYTADLGLIGANVNVLPTVRRN